MSEDVILYFREAHWLEISATLDHLAPRHPERATLPYRPMDGWLYPEGLNFVTLERYTDCQAEHEPENIEALHRLLGGPPSCSLGVNFRRQRLYDTCTIVQFLCCKLLRLFPSLVDDNLRNLWALEEIETGVAKAEGKFLDSYRT